VTTARVRQYSGTIVVLVGLLTAAVPAFDMWDDIYNQGDPPVTTVFENLPLVFLCGAVVAGGVWLATSDLEGRYARTVARLTVGTVAGVAGLVALVVFVQFRLQGEPKPLIIAADAVVVGAIGGVLIGVRTAQQQRAIDDAERQRNRAQALFDNHTDAVVSVTREEGSAAVGDVNDEFENVFGYGAGDIDDLGVLVPEDGEDPGNVPAGELLLADGRDDQVRHEVTRETADGEREFIRQTVLAGAGEAYVVYTDITAQKEREYQLEFLNSLLRHDIQNGMTVIRSRAQFLAETLDGREAEFAATIEKRSNDLVELTDRFRVMLDALTGDVKEELGPIQLDEVVDEGAEVLSTSFPDAEVAVDVPPATVRADDLLEYVVWNLLSNAVEHNDAETPGVTVTAEDRGDAVRLEIADDGPGVPDDLKDAIFRRQESGVDNEVGSGFGLFFVEEMIARYGGEVWVEDNDPEGAVFVVTLPKPSG